jgi:hypothetical protein
MINSDAYSMCVDFHQLASGKWAGHSSSGTYVTVEIFDKGKHPNRLKNIPYQIATEQEADEYWEIRAMNSIFDHL